MDLLGFTHQISDITLRQISLYTSSVVHQLHEMFYVDAIKKILLDSSYSGIQSDYEYKYKDKETVNMDFGMFIRYFLIISQYC